MGKRLGDLTRNSTKCMVPVNDKRLIDYAMEALLRAGIRRFVLVVGHGAEELERVLSTTYKDVEIVYVLNPDYAKTNNIYSLYLARQEMERDDSLLLESDVIFDQGILDDCIRHPSPNVAVVAKLQSWMDGTVTKLDDGGAISCFVSKNDMVSAEIDQYYKTVNIYKLSRGFCRDKFFPFLHVYIQAKGLNEYYEEVLKVLTFIDRGTILASDVGDKLWYEIDDLQDLEIAGALFAKDAAKLKAFQRRYGGYWRFPALKDFCYLVNPFFPTPRFLEDMGREFAPLLTSYPSGQSVQNLLAAKMFGCSPSQVLVGNGASELIKGLMPECSAPMALAVPTFDEYRACAPAGQVKPIHPRGGSFHYSAGELSEFCAANGTKTLILINPDNPSGNFIPKDEVLALLERLSASGTRLVYDESFSDFVDGTDGHSLFDPGILSRHPGLVAVKSISKSYGVPGIRLGVIASADKDLLGRVRSRLSIWNINSFGEQFFQAIPKSKADFRHACKLIAEERERFFGLLEGVPFLKPIPSKANYILCRVAPPWTPTRLAESLLSRSWIFIKDCTGKIGFENAACVRLTVRDRKDNDALIAALRSLAA
jgi:histidinol-phosphate/aromatic aminotransferase/cobyric acid decarboxylase-like protein/choline kinase